ncbi:hypothetical protein MRX96_044303 [Rhipicephalus microplus]
MADEAILDQLRQVFDLCDEERCGYITSDKLRQLGREHFAGSEQSALEFITLTSKLLVSLLCHPLPPLSLTLFGILPLRGESAAVTSAPSESIRFELTSSDSMSRGQFAGSSIPAAALRMTRPSGWSDWLASRLTTGRFAARRCRSRRRQTLALKPKGT